VNSLSGALKTSFILVIRYSSFVFANDEGRGTSDNLLKLMLPVRCNFQRAGLDLFGQGHAHVIIHDLAPAVGVAVVVNGIGFLDQRDGVGGDTPDQQGMITAIRGLITSLDSGIGVIGRRRGIGAHRLRDVVEGYVSLEKAVTDYGVVISKDSLEINLEATEELRRRRRREQT